MTTEVRSRPAPGWPRKAATAAAILIPALVTGFAVWRAASEGVAALSLGLFAGMYLLSGFGITVGFHRMLTHNSLEAWGGLKAALLVAGCMAVQGSPVAWAAGHLEHHTDADGEGDPHSPRRGLTHAHAGWLLTHSADPARFARHLLQDRVVMAVDRTWGLWALLGLAAPWAIGGFEGLLWGGFVRIFAVHHATWCVNSICHRFGARPFDTHDGSRNNAFVALIALGEGWHNNHHAFPASAIQGLRWFEVDLSGLLIRALARVGLVRRFKGPPPGVA